MSRKRSDGRHRFATALTEYLDAMGHGYQAEFAEEVGLSASGLSMIANGHRFPPPDTADRIIDCVIGPQNRDALLHAYMLDNMPGSALDRFRVEGSFGKARKHDPTSEASEFSKAIAWLDSAGRKSTAVRQFVEQTAKTLRLLSEL